MLVAILILNIIIIFILAGQSGRVTDLEEILRPKGARLTADMIDDAFGKPDYLPEKDEKPKLPRKKRAVKRTTTLRKVK